MGCTFCESPEIKKRIIAKEDLVWAFPTNIPIVPGHTLIAPVRCVQKIRDLTREELLALFGLLEKIKSALKKSFGAEGFNHAWNEGYTGGQSVPHFHIHVLPRKPGDVGITEYEPRKFLYRPGPRPISEEKELQEVARMIMECL